MPDIRDNSTVEAIAQHFCGDGKRNKTRTMLKVGYGTGYADTGRGQEKVFGNARVIAAIARIDAKTAKKLDHDRTIAIDMLVADYANLADAADRGNIQAVQARTAIVRELNAISNLHSSTLHTDTEQQRVLADSEREEAARLATILLVRDKTA